MSLLSRTNANSTLDYKLIRSSETEEELYVWQAWVALVLYLHSLIL